MYNKLTIKTYQLLLTVEKTAQQQAVGYPIGEEALDVKGCSEIRDDKILHGFGAPWESTQNEVDFE